MKQNNKIASLHNDHFRVMKAMQEQKRLRRKVFMRRLTLHAIVGIVVFGVLTGILISKSMTLHDKQAEKVIALQSLDKAKERQEMLKMQIKKLEDDEYIAKLLRKEYYLSERGEIIFVIPEQ